MSFQEFQLSTGQLARTRNSLFKSRRRLGKELDASTRASANRDVFSGAKGLRDLRDQRAALGSTYDKSLDVDATNDANFQVDINRAFAAYENDPSIAGLTKLNDAITFFRTMFHGMEWLKEYEPVLQRLSQQIKAELNEKMQAEGLLGDDAQVAMDAGTAAPPSRQPRPMPLFLKDVGVSQSYYEQHIGNDEQVISELRTCYAMYQAGGKQIYHAAYLFSSGKLRTLPGIRFIKSLYAARFPQEANLANLVGTSAEDNTAPTPEEVTALKAYSGGDFVAMNTQLREKATRTAGSFRLRMGAHKTPVVKDARGNIVPSAPGTFVKQQDERVRTMQLAVSAMNKLPVYQGQAYRVLVNTPQGILDVMKPGALTADIGFSSASSSMQGVRNYGYSGIRCVYYIIHAKSAVNIVGYSHSASEGEVLFKPGTKFLVNSVWEYQNGKIPAAAPPEAKMILFEFGTYKENGEAGYKAEFLSDGGLKGHKVKVIEVTEV